VPVLVLFVAANLAAADSSYASIAENDGESGLVSGLTSGVSGEKGGPAVSDLGESVSVDPPVASTDATFSVSKIPLRHRKDLLPRGPGVPARPGEHEQAYELPEDPNRVPKKDFQSYHAQLNNAYRDRIFQKQAELDMMEQKNSMEAIKTSMVINELELNRAEACRNVLRAHGVEAALADWKTQPQRSIDNALAGARNGYDTPMVPENYTSTLTLSPTPAPGPNIRDVTMITLNPSWPRTMAANQQTPTNRRLLEAAEAGNPNDGPKELHEKISKMEDEINEYVKDAPSDVSSMTSSALHWQKVLQQKKDLLEVLKQRLHRYEAVKNECIPFLKDMRARRSNPKYDFTAMIVKGLDKGEIPQVYKHKDP